MRPCSSSIESDGVFPAANRAGGSVLPRPLWVWPGGSTPVRHCATHATFRRLWSGSLYVQQWGRRRRSSVRSRFVKALEQMLRQDNQVLHIDDSVTLRHGADVAACNDVGLFHGTQGSMNGILFLVAEGPGSPKQMFGFSSLSGNPSPSLSWSAPYREV